MREISTCERYGAHPGVIPIHRTAGSAPSGGPLRTAGYCSVDILLLPAAANVTINGLQRATDEAPKKLCGIGVGFNRRRGLLERNTGHILLQKPTTDQASRMIVGEYPLRRGPNARRCEAPGMKRPGVRVGKLREYPQSKTGFECLGYQGIPARGRRKSKKGGFEL